MIAFVVCALVLFAMDLIRGEDTWAVIDLLQLDGVRRAIRLVMALWAIALLATA